MEIENEGKLEKQIREVIEERTKEIYDEVTNRAIVRMEQRLKEVCPEIIMSILKYYEVRTNENNIVITIKKQENNEK